MYDNIRNDSQVIRRNKNIYYKSDLFYKIYGHLQDNKTFFLGKFSHYYKLAVHRPMFYLFETTNLRCIVAGSILSTINIE